MDPAFTDGFGDGDVPCRQSRCVGTTCIFSDCYCVSTTTTTIPCNDLCQQTYGSRVTGGQCYGYPIRPIQCTIDYGTDAICSSSYIDPFSNLPCCEASTDPDCTTCWTNCNTICTNKNQYVSQCFDQGDTEFDPDYPTIPYNCECTPDNNCSRSYQLPNNIENNPCFVLPNVYNQLNAGWTGCYNGKTVLNPNPKNQCCCTKTPSEGDDNDEEGDEQDDESDDGSEDGDNEDDDTDEGDECAACSVTSIVCPEDLQLAGNSFQIGYKYMPASSDYPYPVRKLYVDGATTWEQCVSSEMNPTCAESEGSFTTMCPAGGAQEWNSGQPRATVPYYVGCWGSATGVQTDCDIPTPTATCDVDCQYCTTILKLTVNVTAPKQIDKIRSCSLELWWFSNATNGWHEMFPDADPTTQSNPAYSLMRRNNIESAIGHEEPKGIDDISPGILYTFDLNTVIAPGWYRWNTECWASFSPKVTAPDDWTVYVDCPPP